MPGSFNNAVCNIAATGGFNLNLIDITTNVINLGFGTALQYLTNGVGALQAQWIAANTIAVPNGSPVTLNLNTLTQPDGSTFTPLDILFIGFINTSVTTGQDVTIGGGSNPIVSAFSGNIVLPAGSADNPGTPVCIGNSNATGYAINLSTACNFRLSSAAGTPDVAYLLFGH